jgi:hypothetical protein
MTWLADFEARLQALGNTQGGINPTDPATTALNVIRGMNQLYAGGYSKHAPATSDHGGGIGGALKAGLGGASWLIDKVERPAYAIQDMFENAVKNTGIDYKNLGDKSYLEKLYATIAPVVETAKHPVQDVQQLAEGFSGHKEDGGVFKQQGFTGFKAGAGDFLEAATLDPLNAVGASQVKAVGRGVKYGINAGKDIIKPTDKALADLAKGETATVPAGSKTAKDFLSQLDKIPTETADAPFTIAEPPPSYGTREFHVSPGGETATRRVLALPGPGTDVITGRATVKSITDAMGKIPSLKYSPKTGIAPIYREVTEEIPAEITKPAKAATKKTGLSSSSARVQAMYQHLLTNPSTSRIPVKIGGREQSYSVAQLQQLASKSESQAAMVKQVLVNRARELAGMSKEQLAEAYPEGLKIRFAGRSGAEIPESGVDVEALQHLLETGNIPKTGLKLATPKAGERITPTEAELAVAKHAIPDISDLGNLSLRRLSGEHVSVGDWLSELGVRVNPIKNDVQSLLDSLAGKTKTAKEPVEKSAFESFNKPTTKQITKVVALSREERAQWIKDHGFLDPEDAKALLRMRSVSGFQRKVEEILARQGDAGFTDIEDLIRAIDEGRVNKNDLADLLKITGAKTIQGARQKLNQSIKRLAEAENKMFSGSNIISTQELAQSAAERAAQKVVPAEQIAQNVINHGVDPVLTSEKEVLDPAQAELLKESLTHGVAKNFIDPKNRAKYGFETNRGVKRTMGEYGKGNARHLRSWNAGAQLNAFRSLVSKGVSEHVNRLIKESGAKASGAAGIFAQGSVKYDFIMPILRAQEKILKNEGIPPILGTGETGPLLSTLDVLDSLPKHFVVGTLFDATPRGKQILFTQFNHIAEELLAHGSGKIDEATLREQIGLILTNPIKQYDKTKPAFYSNFAKAVASAAKKDPQAAQDMVNTTVQMFVDALPEIMQRYENNLATYGLKFGENVPKISNDVINRVSQMFTDPKYSPGDIVQISTKIDALSNSIAKHYGVVDPWTTQAASQTAEVHLADVLPPEVKAEAKAAAEYSKAEMGNLAEAVENQKVAAVGLKQSKSDSTAVDAIADAADIADLGQRIEMSLAYRIFRGWAPHLGNKDLHPLLVGNTNATQYFASEYAKSLNDLSKMFDKDTLNAAFAEIQRGTIPAEENVAKAFDLLKPAVDKVFDGNEFASFFNRNGVTLRDINAKLAKYRIHDSYALENPNSWRSFQTDDPLKLLSKFHAAAQSAMTERLVGNRISEKFGSATPKPGFVRVTGGMRVGHIIDKSLYYPKEVAEQFHILDKALVQFNKPNATNKFLTAFDNFFHSFKAGLTVYRLGHHIRNVVGDAWFSFLAGVNNPGVYKDAMKVMYGNKGRYKDFDLQTALQEMKVNPGEIGKGAYKTRIGGKAVTLTHKDIWALATQSGIITDYHAIEDIADTPGVQKFLTQHLPTHGRVHKVAVATSEAREHAVRLAHFIDIIKKGNFKSVNDLKDEAGAIVRKWHPDGSDLGTTEKATARRVFLFYSWMRKAIPLVIESAVYNPGKSMLYPKAYYAIAESMGVDLNGFGDPYPTDQLFPDWIRENIEGPIAGSAGHYYAAHPGVPTADIANEFLGSPGGAAHNIAGSISPAIRTPLEVLTGNSFGTGTPIKDKTDYIDQNVPGLNTLSSLLNRSASSGFTQPTSSVAKGNESGGPDGLAFLNWLTGAGIQDISRPNYIKSAQLAMRDKARGR